VGWFLHTPFPSSEIYRTLPVREEVLRAVLKADLIGGQISVCLTGKSHAFQGSRFGSL
jgi:trehalose-6-phosphate synthase